MPRHDTRPLLVKGPSGTVETYPPTLGVPSSATVRVGTGSAAMPTNGSAATVDPFSRTLAAAGAQGDVSLTFVAPGSSTSASGSVSTADADPGEVCRADLAVGSYSFTGSARGDANVTTTDGSKPVKNVAGNVLPGEGVPFSGFFDFSSTLLDNSVNYYLVSIAVVGAPFDGATITAKVVTNGGNCTISNLVISGPNASGLRLTSSGLQLLIGADVAFYGSSGVSTATFSCAGTCTPTLDVAAFRSVTFVGTIDNGTLSAVVTEVGDDGIIGGAWTIDVALESDGDLAITVVGSTGAGTISWTGSLTITALSSTASFVRGRQYLIDGTTTLLVVTCDQDDGSGTTMQIAEPLPCAIASGATVKGIRLSTAISSSDTATIGPGVAEWQATIGGVVHKWASAFRVVERDGTYTLTPAVLTNSSPYCKLNRPENDTDYTEMIDAAWRRFVEPDLLGKALRPERIVHGPHFEAAHIAACEYFLSIEYEDDAQRRAERKANLATAMEKVLHASDLWITSEAEDLTSSATGELGLTGAAAGQMPIGMNGDGSAIFAPNDFDVCFVDR